MNISAPWRSADYLTVRQAAALIAGVDPNAVHESGDYFIDQETHLTTSEGITQVQAALAVLANAINAKTLAAKIRRTAWERGWDEEPEAGERLTRDVEVLDSDTDEWPDADPLRPKRRGVIYRVAPDWGLTTVERETLINWLRIRGLRPACFFPDAPQGPQTPDYLDRQNLRYSAKLAASVTAWQSVTHPAPRSPKQALEKWLREHAAEFGLVNSSGKPVAQAIEECSKVANWNTGGGAPKATAR
jgi:hypothetical protein